MNGTVLNGTDINGSTYINDGRYDLSASGLVDLIVAKTRVVSGSVQANGTASISIIKESYPVFNTQATGSVELDPAIRVYVPSMDINATGSVQVQIYKELGILGEVQANLEAEALITKVGVLQGDLRGTFSTEALITKYGFILPEASLNASLEGTFIKESYPSFLLEGSALAELLVSKDYYPPNLNISATGSIEALVAKSYYPPKLDILGQLSTDLLVYRRHILLGDILATGSIRRLFTLVHPFGLGKDQFVHQMYRDIPPEIMFKEEE